jgi:hypothetical protein
MSDKYIYQQDKPLCITTWDAVLRLESLGRVLARVSDPCAVDAGQYISIVEIKAILRIKALNQ